MNCARNLSQEICTGSAAEGCNASNYCTLASNRLVQTVGTDHSRNGSLPINKTNPMIRNIDPGIQNPLYCKQVPLCTRSVNREQKHRLQYLTFGDRRNPLLYSQPETSCKYTQIPAHRTQTKHSENRT
jgi:hypothetical protein